jgi:predicted aminopeptidase
MTRKEYMAAYVRDPKNKARAELRRKRRCKFNRLLVDCRKATPCMDFDHRDEDSKRMGVSEMFMQCFSVGSLLAELNKCDIVCANCHRFRTLGAE